MKSRFGIVCVHGIGRQAQGQTAREVATAVRRGAQELGGSAVDAEPSADALPGSLTLDVDLPNSDPFQVVLHDGRWDHLVEPPPWRTVLLWMLRVAPFAIWLTMAGWVSDILDVQERHGRKDSLVQMLPAGTVMLLPLVAPLLVAVAILITPAVLLNRRFATATRTVVSVWIGDAWMYRSDRLDESAIAAVRDLVEHAQQSSHAVVVLGHSQGAEIGRRVAITTDVDACVWVGSGEFPLGVFRMLSRSPGMVVALWGVLLTFPIVFAIVATALWNGLVGLISAVWGAFDWLWPPRVLTPGGLSDRMSAVSDGFFDFAWSGVGEMLFALAYFGVAFWVIMRLRKAPVDQLNRPPCEVFVVKSLLDPVCLGPRDDTEFVRFVPVGRPSAWWREHIAYFGKPETGVAVLESIVGSHPIQRVPYVPRMGVGVHMLGAFAMGTTAYLLWALGTWMLGILPF
ncbi:hypothetical protein [Paramicrobacterium agarici]|uniref:hypothetical protein n=1 Tax=Paramicrobacterium agarici TaxID=630514 RepID=UPI00114ED015|nr:hypothetical protein [Microbacterium agarici]